MEHREQIQHNFGRRAKNYRASSVHNNLDDLDRMIQLLNPSPGDKGLDVATGAGHTAHKLAGYISQVVAVDITRQMLAEAEDGAKEKGLTNLEFCLGDVHQLNFPDHEFDIVVSRFAVHHFSQVKTALREMCRVLKPGGKLYILDCSTVDGAEAEEQMNLVEYLRDNSHVCSYSPRRWQNMLGDLPLTVSHANLLSSRYELPQWFNRMDTTAENRREIVKVLDQLSDACKADYTFGPDFITTYRIELVAHKIAKS